MQWLLVLVVAVLALVVIGWVISALKWLLIIAAVVVLAGVVFSALTGRDSHPS